MLHTHVNNTIKMPLSTKLLMANKNKRYRFAFTQCLISIDRK